MAAFQNPEFYRKQAMRLPTFDTPRIIGCCEEFPLHIGLPRGCLDEVIACFDELGVAHTTKDERFPGCPIHATFTGELRPQQVLAADALLKHDTGVLAATTAFGKTVVAAYLIAKRKVNTLVLVHNRELLDQWLARLSTFLDLPASDIGQIRSGKKRPTGIVDVAMIQSLGRKGVVDDLVGEYGHLVVDECHHIPARSFEIVARQSKARFVTGLSATACRKDGHQPIIFMNCGPVRYCVGAKEEAAKRPFEHRVIVRRTQTAAAPTPPGGDGRALPIQDFYRLLTHDHARNAMIARDVTACVAAGRSPVVLTERRDHLQLLEELLRPLTENLVVLTGGMGVKDRRQRLEHLRSVPEGEPRVLLATGRYLGEGFDDARLDTLFLTLPISWRGTIAQYAGRLHRLHEGKREVQIYDYVDAAIPMAVKMHERRCGGYRSLGYSVEEEDPPESVFALGSDPVRCEHSTGSVVSPESPQKTEVL
jgi:superfamily II DNA or RNA helicase